MLRITGHQQNAHKTPGVSPHPSQDSYHPEIKKQEMLRRTGRERYSSILSVGMQTGTIIMEDRVE